MTELAHLFFTRSVPSMALDLMESSAAGFPLESVSFGGASAPDILPTKASQAFPSATLYVSSFLARCLLLDATMLYAGARGMV